MLDRNLLSVSTKLVAAITCASVAGLGTCLVGCDSRQNGNGSDAGGSATGVEQTASIEAAVCRPVLRSIMRHVRVTGTLRGDEEATISAKVGGRVVEVNRDLGDAVGPGDLLARVDPTDYQLTLDERARAFSQALAKLGLGALPQAEFAVDALPSVQKAKLEAENAKAKFERGRMLAERLPPLISEQDFADLRTAWEVAQSNVEVERLTAEAGLAEARMLEAQVRIARQRLEDTNCRAPVDDRQYRVSKRMMAVGDLVQAGSPLFELVDPDPVKLRATVPEKRVGEVRIGQRAKVSVNAYPELVFSGHISRISPMVDETTRSFAVEIVVANDEGLLKPGSFGTADVERGEEEVMLVPASALITFAGVQKVLTVGADARAQEKRVNVGERVGGLIEIRSGLTTSDLVVVDPPASLTTGSAVRAVESVLTSDQKETP